MIHDFLVRQGHNLALQTKWLQPLDGLVRALVPAPDNTHGAVVVYSEKRRRYDVQKVDLAEGTVEWCVPVLNGGYGSPAFLDDLVIVHTQFTGVEALDWRTGEAVWRFVTDSRVRSSVTTETGLIVLSSGPDVIGLNRNGQEVFRHTVARAFFFGAVKSYEGGWLSLATVTAASGESRVRLISLGPDGAVRWDRDLGAGSIASSDTSGVWLDGDRIYVSGPDALFAIAAADGALIWSHAIGGLAHRHSCVSDGSRVFYTTVDGRVGAFTCDGAALWERHLSHQGIWSPPSLLGDRVAVICNGLLQLLNGATGALVQQIAVGHCPYSAVTFAGERAFLGGGDPPYHGMLIGFDVQVDAVQPLSCSFTQQRRMIGKEDAIDLVLQVSGASASIDRIVVDFSALDGPANAVAQARDGDRFMFNVTPGPGQRWGAYALPVVIETALGRRVATALLEFDHPAPGPRRAILPGFDDIVQEEPDWSGAALMAAMRRRYGDAVEQRDMREMVDAVRERAGYLPFDTWRIVARRALSTSAKTVSEMDEFRDDAPRA